MLYRIIKKAVFKKSPKQPIEVADNMLMHAMIIACGYAKYKKFVPSENDLKLFDDFAEELHTSYLIAVYISNCMHERHEKENGLNSGGEVV